MAAAARSTTPPPTSAQAPVTPPRDGVSIAFAPYPGSPFIPPSLQGRSLTVGSEGSGGEFSPGDSRLTSPLWRSRSRGSSGGSATLASSPTYVMPAVPLDFQGSVPLFSGELVRLAGISGNGYKMIFDDTEITGGHSTVYKLEKDGNIFAKKTCLSRDQAFHEARCLAALAGPEMVRCAAVIDAKTETSLILSWAGNETLSGHTLDRENTVRLAHTLARVLVRAQSVEWQVGETVQRGLLLGDLAPTNIGMNGDEFTLFDLERAGPVGRILEEKESATPSYRAPEIWKEQPATAQSEVWAAGAILFEALKGESFVNSNVAVEQAPEEVYAYIQGLSVSLPDVDRALADLVTAMLQIEPGMRPTPEELLNQIETLWPLGSV